MDSAEQALLLITMALFYALLVERCTEVLMACLEYCEVRKDWQRFWRKRAQRLAQQLSQPGQGFWQQELQQAMVRYLTQEANGVAVVSVAKVRLVMLQVVSKCVAVGLGIVLAFAFELNLAVALDQLNASSGEQAGRYFSAQLPSWLALLLSGIVMGLGAGPLHKVISALERARADNKEVGRG